jgi:uncharacterized protein (DUF433 family)
VQDPRQDVCCPEWQATVRESQAKIFKAFEGGGTKPKDCTAQKLSDMQKLATGCYRINCSRWNCQRGSKWIRKLWREKPCVKGIRIPVYVLLQKMAAGETEAELWKLILNKKTDIMAVWEYPARAAAEEIVLAESWVRLLFDENLSILSAPIGGRHARLSMF